MQHNDYGIFIVESPILCELWRTCGSNEDEGGSDFLLMLAYISIATENRGVAVGTMRTRSNCCSVATGDNVNIGWKIYVSSAFGQCF